MIDCVVHGNMELFEMVHQPDMWHTIGTGAYRKIRLSPDHRRNHRRDAGLRGGQPGGIGMYDVVLAIGFEKLQEGHTTGGITNMADPLWARKLQSGALTAQAAVKLIAEFGEARARRAAMTYRIIMDKHACKNPNAHRAFHLEWDQMEDLMEHSPPLIGDLRLIHMCSQSDGACAIIFASEKKPNRSPTPRLGTRSHHGSPGRDLNLHNNYYPIETTHRFAAETALCPKRN
jgi:acetyl-CoA C-acetyltransferase